VPAVLVSVACALTLSVASPAHAAPNVARAWGFNNDGELGNGTTRSSDVPVAVTGLRGVTAVAGGSHHSLALLEDGSVVAWGENRYGQLGDGTAQGSVVPVAVSGLREVAAISAGGSFSLALLKSGRVVAWGNNGSGQLGDGGTKSSDVPVAVSGLREVAAISAGRSFGLALLKSGKVMAWGENAYGQLGDGTKHGSDTPVATSGLSKVTAVAAGSWHSLALLSSDTVMAWGDNEDGQLGDGSETASDVPVAVSKLIDVSGISAGRSHSLAVLATGAVMAWGDNVEGQLGDGSHTGPEQCGVPPVFACSKRPVEANGLREVTAVSAHGNHNMALLGNGTVMAWGQNTSGELGNGTTGPEVCGNGSCSTTPVLVCAEGLQVPCPTGPELSNVKGIAAGEAHSLAVVEPPPPASALPELGRCLKVQSGGAYTGTSPSCILVSSTHTGYFEWLPGPGPKAKFQDQLTEPSLETVANHKLSCVDGFLEGQYAGAKTATVSHLTLAGCRDITTNASCQTNPLYEGLIEGSASLGAGLGFIASGESPSVGWDLKPKPPAASLVSFECGSGVSTTALALEGSVIGRATPIDAMVSRFELEYAQSGGMQVPQFLEGGPREVLTLTTTPVMGMKTSEQAGLKSKSVRAGEEPLEIKAKI
jgi:alpha-tubulin suppressor-like RCC1 family protein